ADALARLHLEVDVANGPQPSSAVTPDELRQALDERRRVLVLDVALADVGHAHGAGLVLHSRSTITRSKRLKSRAANTPSPTIHAHVLPSAISEYGRSPRMEMRNASTMPVAGLISTSVRKMPCTRDKGKITVDANSHGCSPAARR